MFVYQFSYLPTRPNRYFDVACLTRDTHEIENARNGSLLKIGTSCAKPRSSSGGSLPDIALFIARMHVSKSVFHYEDLRGRKG